jgi:hypothetical protein
MAAAASASGRAWHIKTFEVSSKIGNYTAGIPQRHRSHIKQNFPAAAYLRHISASCCSCCIGGGGSAALTKRHASLALSHFQLR